MAFEPTSMRIYIDRHVYIYFDVFMDIKNSLYMPTCIHISRLEHLYCSDLISEADLAVIYKRLTHTSSKSSSGSAFINEQNNGKNPEKSKQICDNILMKYYEKNKKIVDNRIEDFMSVRHDNVSKFRPPDFLKISGLGGPVLGKEIVFE